MCPQTVEASVGALEQEWRELFALLWLKLAQKDL